MAFSFHLVSVLYFVFPILHVHVSLSCKPSASQTGVTFSPSTLRDTGTLAAVGHSVVSRPAMDTQLQLDTLPQKDTHDSATVRQIFLRTLSFYVRFFMIPPDC